MNDVAEKTDEVEVIETGPMIYDAILRVMERVGAIGKDGANTQQNFNFRKMEAVYDRLHPIMLEEKVFTTSEIIERVRETHTTSRGGTLHFTMLRIKYRFHTIDGSFVDAEVVGEGMDSGDKASNKAMTAAHKYALGQVLMIPFNVYDGDKDNPVDDEDFTPIADDQVVIIRDYIESGIVPEKTMDWLNERDFDGESPRISDVKAQEVIEYLKKIEAAQ